MDIRINGLRQKPEEPPRSGFGAVNNNENASKARQIMDDIAAGRRRVTGNPGTSYVRNALLGEYQRPGYTLPGRVAADLLNAGPIPVPPVAPPPPGPNAIPTGFPPHPGPVRMPPRPAPPVAPPPPGPNAIPTDFPPHPGPVQMPPRPPRPSPRPGQNFGAFGNLQRHFRSGARWGVGATMGLFGLSQFQRTMDSIRYRDLTGMAMHGALTGAAAYGMYQALTPSSALSRHLATMADGGLAALSRNRGGQRILSNLSRFLS